MVHLSLPPARRLAALLDKSLLGRGSPRENGPIVRAIGSVVVMRRAHGLLCLWHAAATTDRQGILPVHGRGNTLPATPLLNDATQLVALFLLGFVRRRPLGDSRGEPPLVGVVLSDGD